MSNPLFGAMAMFYAVTSGAGGGGVTPPSSFIGAAPQIKFGTAANQGFLSSDGATTGVTLSHAIDVVAGVDTATQVYGGRIRMNSATDFLVIDSSSSGMVPGTPASPTSRLLWAFGSYAQFSDMIIAPSLFINGAVTPSSGEGLAIVSTGGLTQLIAKTWPSGNLDQINIAGNTVNLQVGATTAITSTWTLDSFGQVTQLHNAQAGAAESFYTMQTSDDATALLRFKNATTVNAAFTANMLTIGGSNRQSLVNTITITTDSGTNACWSVNFDVGGSNVVTRPLINFASVGGTLLQLLALSTGNNACLSWGTTTSAAPVFTTRSAGTRLVTYSSIDGTHVDTGIGVRSTGSVQWYTVPAATSGNAHEFYGGITLAATIRGDGLIDATGGIYCSGAVAPSSGQHSVMQMNAGTAIFAGFNYTGAVYLPCSVQGLSVALAPSGTATLTATSTSITSTVPVIFASYTLATLPAAGSFTRGQIWVSDMTGGAQFAYSDGTNWRRVSDGTIAS